MGQSPEIDPLFLALAEQLKLPFVHIAQSVELARGQASLESVFDDVSLSTQAALRLIDGYLLNARLQAEAQLELEPVPLSSVLYDTAAKLHKYAKAQGCTIELDIKGKYVPVFTHREAVKSALLALGYEFIDAVSAQPAGKRIVTLGATKTPHGISTGLYAEQTELTARVLQKARQLHGKARRPFGGFVTGSGAGIFLADALLGRLEGGPLHVARLDGRQGLAATLLPSRQLSLV